jgi:hypothetical protein
VSKSLSLNDLYRLVFRGLKLCQNMFQLAHANGSRVIAPSTRKTATQGLQDGEVITVSIADDANTGEGIARRGVSAEDLALVKVCGIKDDEDMVVAFWVSRYTTQTIAFVKWKHWRTLAECSCCRITPTRMQMWTDISSSDDGLLEGTPQQILLTV